MLSRDSTRQLENSVFRSTPMAWTMSASLRRPSRRRANTVTSVNCAGNGPIRAKEIMKRTEPAIRSRLCVTKLDGNRSRGDKLMNQWPIAYGDTGWR